MIGPHFYFDLVRLPRKGWSTFFRCFYLLVLLIGLAIMWEGNQGSIRNHAEYAVFAHNFAMTLIWMQDILILMLLPVYVASAIAEERENQTLEALFISPLTDRQIVLGKFGGRLLHLGAVILAGVPLLAFMHLWGNVSVSMLIYHLCNTFLLAMTASSICILVSTNVPVVFQAVTTSYPFVVILGLVAEFLAFGLPWFFAELFRDRTGTSEGIPQYWASMLCILPAHVALTRGFLEYAIDQVGQLRKLETKPIKKTTGSFALTDNRRKALKSKKGKLQGSYIHPLALPIREKALFWKECMKDGSRWSLTFWWISFFLIGIVVASGLGRLEAVLLKDRTAQDRLLHVLAGSFTYTAYFIGLAAYGLVVVFQTTMSVAGEREQNTLEHLLLLPVDRREILFCKWLGPLWRNWPILAVSYLGVLLGAGVGVFSVMTALTLLLLPLPILFMSSFLGLCLSVFCRRALYANIVMVAFLLLLVVGHVVGAKYLTGLFPAYAFLIFETRKNELAELPVESGLPLVFAEQGIFVLLAMIFGGLAYLRFHKT